MLFGKCIPMIPGQTMPDPKGDYRTAEKIGSFRLSALALYQPDGSYFLRSAILNAECGLGSTHTTGCCAGSVPVPRVILTTENQKFQLICDSEKIAARLIAALKKTQGIELL